MKITRKCLLVVGILAASFAGGVASPPILRLVFGSDAMAGQRQPSGLAPSAVVETQLLQVVDAQGNILAALGPSKRGGKTATLRFYDGVSKFAPLTVGFDKHDRSPEIRMRDVRGKTRVLLVYDQGNSLLTFYGPKEQPRLGLSDTARWGTDMSLADQTGYYQASLSVFDGSPTLKLLGGKKEKTRATLGVTTSGKPELWLADDKTHASASALITNNGKPIVTVLDGKGGSADLVPVR